MAYMQLKDVLHHAENFRKYLRDYAERHRRQAKNDYVQGIFKDMTEHEEELRHCLAKFEAETDDRHLETWLQYPGVENLEETMNELAAVDNQEDGIVLQTLLAASEALVELYDQAIAQIEAPALVDLLTKLRDLQDHHLRQMAKSVTELEQS